MKTKEDWVTELGNGVWASDIEKVQRDAFEAGIQAERGATQEDIQRGREEGETDLRQIRAWVEAHEIPFPGDAT